MFAAYQARGFANLKKSAGTLLKYTLATALAGFALAIPPVSGAVPMEKTAHPEDVQTTHKAIPHVINPHLRGATIEVTDKHKVEETAEHRMDRKIDAHWRPRWAAREWMILHRGLGTIQGQVVTKHGEPVAVAEVNLRHGNGHVLASTAAKHITYSGSNGTFTMAYVRAGKYRVVAKRDGKIMAHHDIHVHSGEVVQVTVKG